MRYNPDQLKNDIAEKMANHEGLNLSKVADLVGISKTTIYRVVNNRTPDIAVFAKFCDWLGTEPNRYFTKH